MKVRICKEFDFDAAHSLPFLPEGHKCRRLHGHTYRVIVTCVGEPDPNGMLIDYADLAQPILEQLDHRNLNEVLPGSMPTTTEHVARWIFLELLGPCQLRGVTVERVRVYESSTTWCEVPA